MAYCACPMQAFAARPLLAAADDRTRIVATMCGALFATYRFLISLGALSSADSLCRRFP